MVAGLLGVQVYLRGGKASLHSPISFTLFSPSLETLRAPNPNIPPSIHSFPSFLPPSPSKGAQERLGLEGNKLK